MLTMFIFILIMIVLIIVTIIKKTNVSGDYNRSLLLSSPCGGGIANYCKQPMNNRQQTMLTMFIFMLLMMVLVLVIVTTIKTTNVRGDYKQSLLLSSMSGLCLVSFSWGLV